MMGKGRGLGEDFRRAWGWCDGLPISPLSRTQWLKGGAGCRAPQQNHQRTKCQPLKTVVTCPGWVSEEGGGNSGGKSAGIQAPWALPHGEVGKIVSSYVRVSS